MVTPVALDGSCDRLDHASPSVRRKARKTAAKLVRQSVWRSVVPPSEQRLTADDIEVSLMYDCPVAGGASLRRTPAYQRPGHPRPRRLVHAVWSMPFPVEGPVVLGSGRHAGLGLCAPLQGGSQ